MPELERAKEETNDGIAASVYHPSFGTVSPKTLALCAPLSSVDTKLLSDALIPAVLTQCLLCRRLHWQESTRVAITAAPGGGQPGQFGTAFATTPDAPTRGRALTQTACSAGSPALC